ncbi:hypothetical protein MKW94_003152 [Papaver nudicaule]|uniref:TFIIS central domain-containing protein n=1 Tax=Papaver nudicaule TaxID=74823 RepID=A0AA42B2G4_PAPNU|nr:hypothetical protein [Papaver nudicaule]
MAANSGSPRLQHQAVSNSKVAPISPNMGGQGLQHFAVQNNKHVPILPNSSNLGHVSVSNKRTIQMISGTPNKPAPQKSSAANKPSKRPAHTEPPKAKAESYESVRAKMRESLASALAMVSEEQNKNAENNSQVDAQITSVPPTEDSPMSTSTSSNMDIASSQAPEKPLELLSSQNQDCAQNVNVTLNPSQDVFSSGNKVDAAPIPNSDAQEYQFKYALLDDDVSFSNNFFVKDDLLQGNGLCWASDLDIEIIEDSVSYGAKKLKLEVEVGGNKTEPASPCPQTLATRVEAELFKAFGGVNKKYKEKGRSLLFNLKDPNNPELRERVISGEISPERLCSMTAEELASKELSEWRIAKAEELAQMVVLPDSQVDIRRLVRKTHKGEFQVEFDEDDGPSVEVAGESSSSEFRPRAKEVEAETPRKADENGRSEISSSDKVILDDQSSLSAVPGDGTDLLQGLMMDEMKDPEFLPPIVSLDEFMDSLHSEPPFENLQKEAGTSVSVSIGEEKTSNDTDSKMDSSDLTSVSPVTAALKKAAAVDKAPIGDKATAQDKADKVEPEHTSPVTKLKSGEVLIESKTSLDGAAANIEHAWEGKLQLNVSSIVTVHGSFISGEKASTKEWPSFLDIKGRVKLDAFGKFLQELPMSRSRALMVVHFSGKEDSPESGRGNLREVADSYVADERVGFAEPAPAVELYLCPPHVRTVEMLGKNVPKDDVEKLNAIDNGLIGIVVWRKVHVTSTISSNSSSHHKHSSKKQNHLRRQQQEKETNRTTKPTSSILGPPPTRNSQVSVQEPVDDIPPGFGPATGRDDDDLPEFEFASGSNPPVSQFSSSKLSVPPRTSFAPPGQVRELIQMYGQNETTSNKGVNWQQQTRSARLEANKSWNDDDDIPEWQGPEQIMPVSLPPPPPLPMQLMHGYQQQTLPHVVVATPQQLPHGQLMVHQLTQQNMPFQAPVNMLHSSYVGGHQNMASPWQSGGWNPQTGSSGLPLNVQQQGNNMMQPCNNNNNNNNNSINGHPFDGQFYGTSSNTGNGFGTGQRPDNGSRRY